MNPCRVPAAGLASAAARVVFASVAPVASAPVGSAPHAFAPLASGTESHPGITVVAGDVVVRLGATGRAAAVEIARHDDGPDLRIPVGVERSRRSRVHMLAGP